MLTHVVVKRGKSIGIGDDESSRGIKGDDV